MNFRHWLENWQEGLPEQGHDYDAGWDYEIDEQPQLMQMVNNIVAKLKSNLLPAIRVFRDFNVQFVTGLDDLGRYAYGTYSHPVVMLDMKNIQQSCERHGVECELGIETTIVHELAHAIQEAHGMEMDEEEAEEFARQWWYNKKSTNFWQ